MGAGDIPVWVMRAGPDAAADRPAGRLDAGLRGAECPPLHGAFQVAIRVDDVDGAAMGVARSEDTFWVRSGQDVGLLAVPYRVDAAAVERGGRPAARGGSVRA